MTSFILNRMSVRKRMTLALLFIAMIATAITMLVMLFIGIINLEQNFQDELDSSTRIVGERNRVTVQFSYPVEANSILAEAFEKQPSIARACLYDGEGALLAAYLPSNPSSSCPAALEDISFKDKTFNSYYAIEDYDGTLGHLHVEADRRRIEAYLKRQLKWMAVAAVLIVLFTILLATFLQRMISSPIIQLADIAKRISHEQDYSIRATCFLHILRQRMK